MTPDPNRPEKLVSAANGIETAAMVTALAEDDSPAKRLARVAGWLLFLAGAGPCIGSLVWATITAMSLPLAGIRILWLLGLLVLILAVKRSLLRKVPRQVVWILIGGWLVYCLDALTGTAMYFYWELRRQPEQFFLAVMIATFGLLLVFSNDPRNHTVQCAARLSAFARTFLAKHLKGALAIAVIVLYLFNPDNSHELCIRASSASEKVGAYGLAIRFTAMALDTFPSQTWCGTCLGQIESELVRRMCYLEQKRLGLPVPPATSAQHTPRRPEESTNSSSHAFITAAPQN
jgi:hypothetical protein